MSAVNFIWLLLAWRRLFERATQFRRTLDQSVGGDLIGRVRRQTRCMLSAFLVGVPVKSTGQTQLGFPARSASDPATLLSAEARYTPERKAAGRGPPPCIASSEQLNSTASTHRHGSPTSSHASPTCPHHGCQNCSHGTGTITDITSRPHSRGTHRMLTIRRQATTPNRNCLDIPNSIIFDTLSQN